MNLSSFRRIAGALALAMPALASAENDLDVTMRMVMDDESLDSSFVQEMELPEALTNDNAEQTQLDALELRDDARELQETLSSQAREARNALSEELPGEVIVELPELDTPQTELPDLEPPEPELPVDDLPTLGTDPLDTGTELLPTE